jgi:hypothetical protein
MDKKISVRLLGAVALVFTIGAGQLAMAQTTLPQPVSQPQPPNPTNASRMPMPVEGWAIVRYSVLSDGSTSNVHVTGIAPPVANPAATVEAVRQWRFSPATVDGEATDWHNNESVIVFGDVAIDDDATEEFRMRFEEEIASLLDLQEYDDAEKANTELLNEYAITKEQVAVALTQAGIIKIGQLDLHAAHRLLNLATNPQADAWDDEFELRVALQLKLQTEVQLGLSGEALNTYDRIAALLGPDDVDQFGETASSLRSIRETSEILEALGEITEGSWRFNLDRRIFTIDNVMGSISSIDAECDKRRLSLEFQPQVEWQLPDSLGDCVLFVNAEPGTSFSLFEMLPAAD